MVVVVLAKATVQEELAESRTEIEFMHEEMRDHSKATRARKVAEAALAETRAELEESGAEIEFMQEEMQHHTVRSRRPRILITLDF